jgi:hypothetical protein
VERSLKVKTRRNAKASDRDWERWDKEFGADLNEALAAIVGREGAIYAQKLAGDFDSRRVVNYLRATAEGAAAAINGTVREEVREFGAEDALARRGQHVESAGAGLGARAVRFAREEAARQSPGYEQRVKTWIPNTKRHAQFGGTTVPIGADWPAGFAPGSAPGCKCSQSIT